MPAAPQWKLRRLSSRAVNVLERHKDKEPALAAYIGSLLGSAQAYSAAYDRAQASKTGQALSMSGRQGAIRTLHRKMRGWTAMLVNDVEGFERSTFGDRPDVPEDVISDAERLLVVLDDYGKAGGEPPHYDAALREDLGAALEAAKAELEHASSRSARLSDLQAAVRAAGEAFHADLVAFRRTLAAHIGRSHPDYQKLRLSRAGQRDAEDDEVTAVVVGEGEAVPPRRGLVAGAAVGG